MKAGKSQGVNSNKDSHLCYKTEPGTLSDYLLYSSCSRRKRHQASVTRLVLLDSSSAHDVQIPINTTTLTRKKAQFEGDAGDRGLVTGVRSGWGRASRSMRMKYHICQQPVVEFGRVSVNTNALWGEASRDARACVTSTVEALSDFQYYFNSILIFLSKFLSVHLSLIHI